MATTKVDLKPFERGSYASSYGRSSIAGALSALEAHVSGLVRSNVDPHSVSWHEIQAMGRHPMVYLAERTITGVIRRPDLYSVDTKDARVKAEVEEWLWPLMRKGLLDAAARAFAYGNIPVVFNWTRQKLRYVVDDRNRSRDYAYYASAHDLYPYPITNIEAVSDQAVSFSDVTGTYGEGRIHHFCWDREFGDLRGQGARYRAFCDYTTSMVIELLQSTYLERSVDAPRVAYAPPGTIDPNDADALPAAEYVASLITAMRGGGAAVFPSVFDAEGNKLYDLDVMDLPDRDEVWLRALGRFDSRILIAYLTSPTLAGIESMAAAASRSLEGMLKEFVQDLADWTASNLTEIVARVYRANDTGKPPEIRATDVGKAGAKKMLLEVLKIASEPTSTYVDVAKGLDCLGVPVLETPRPMPSAQPEGRPRDMAGDREERRERGQTDSGEESTGKEGDT